MEAKKPHPLGFVCKDGCISGPLKVGIKIEGNLHKTFEMREALLDDLLDAENEVDVTKPLNFNAELVARQLIKVGSYEGPFTVGMLRGRMKPADWRILRAAQTELDLMGEAGSASEKDS